MATEFKKLSEVTTLEEVADTAHVLVEENGEIYRAPKTAVGGAGGVKVAIIRDEWYMDWIDYMTNNSGKMTKIGLPSPEFECINMTFDEAWNTIVAGEPLQVMVMVSEQGIVPALTVCPLDSESIGVMYSNGYEPLQLVWSESGISIPESNTPS